MNSSISLQQQVNLLMQQLKDLQALNEKFIRKNEQYRREIKKNKPIEYNSESDAEKIQEATINKKRKNCKKEASRPRSSDVNDVSDDKNKPIKKTKIDQAPSAELEQGKTDVQLSEAQPHIIQKGNLKSNSRKPPPAIIS